MVFCPPDDFITGLDSLISKVVTVNAPFLPISAAALIGIECGGRGEIGILTDANAFDRTLSVLTDATGAEEGGDAATLFRS